MANRGDVGLEDDPLWYKDAIIYELHVRAFYDSNADGIGDFRGLTEKLDYLQDLGVTALWLLPFYPSPLRDDGYDIADYRSVHEAYGTLNDFRRFLREAHKRGMRVITELVINHTSDEHPWFRKARHARPGTRTRDYYVWSETADRYQDARIIFQDFEVSNWSWDREAEAYYWHRFYSHQPDLNFENPSVRRAVLGVLDFWLRAGVDGFRLDAIPYLHEAEGTNCENLPETHEFLKQLRSQVDDNFDNRLLLAEANQWPEDAAEYFGNGDECHMNFHFPLMPRLFMAIQQEDRFPIVDILEQTPEIPDSAQWAIFLRNHDELTLEMVTDEERDYMYRVYAHESEAKINLGIRRRLAPLLQNNRRKIELMNGLLFSLPGTPVLYYGDEIGMGDNYYLGDRHGVRTPMQWSGDRNAGFSDANPQRLYLPPIVDPEYNYTAVNVETQQANPSSLLWWMKRLIALRKHSRAFGRGTLEFLQAENRKVLAYVRCYEDERILVIANLSRFTQNTRIDLSDFKGATPVEVFGRTEFPRITENPYFFTLGSHAFYWFALESREAERPLGLTPAIRYEPLAVAGGWDNILRGKTRNHLELLLSEYMRPRRWFRGKAKRIRSLEIVDELAIRFDTDSRAYLTLVRFSYIDGESETYVLPLTYTGKPERVDQLLEEAPHAAVTRLRPGDAPDSEGLLYDAMIEPDFSQALLGLMTGRRRRVRGVGGRIVAATTSEYREIVAEYDDGHDQPQARVLNVEQSNTSVAFGDRLLLKLYRRLDEGESLDFEVGRFLARRGFEHTPRIAGAIQYHTDGREPATLALLQEYIPNEGDAWDFTLDSLGRYFEQVLARGGTAPDTFVSADALIERATGDEIPDPVRELLGAYLESAGLIGRRTAKMHTVLAGAPEAPDFAAEPFSALYQRSLYQSMRNLTGQVFPELGRYRARLEEPIREPANRVFRERDAVLGRFRSLVGNKIDTVRIRCHGDYHLGQLLYTGNNFVITDFEGEPARPLSERRLKRSPLRDVAGMLRSFHYAAYTSLFVQEAHGVAREDEIAAIEPWARFWYGWASTEFLRNYLQLARPAGLLPDHPEKLSILLDAYLLEKAVYEVGYEINNRPDWLIIPLHGILQLLES